MEINQCRVHSAMTPSNRRRVDGVEDDAMISTQAAQQSSASDGSRSFFTQSTKFCSDSVTILPYFFAWAPSMDATVLKVQHDPHDP